uniref:Ubiquitin fusion degradaton n=1 Tax=Tetraselmis sp. GSL018 TaxID=582737 RepID=A0A061QRR2_9CHLO
MFAGELKARQQRLEREQKERAEESKRRAERHRAIAERQRKRQEELEEEKRLRRIEELAAAEKVAQEREELISRNNGVFLETRLRAVATDEELLTGKGIKRAADKIVLPASVGEELMSMDAPKNGAMMFELRTPSGSVTHAGVLEFTAPAGTALLPPKVIRSLWGREARSPWARCKCATRSSRRAPLRGCSRRPPRSRRTAPGR